MRMWMKIAIVIMVVNLGKKYKGNGIFGNYEKQQTESDEISNEKWWKAWKHESRIVEIELSNE